MSYCLNLDCPKPQNPATNLFCQGCGFNLLLHERYRAVKLISQGGISRTFLTVDEGLSPALPCVLKQLWTKNLTPEVSAKATTLFQQEALRLAELGNHSQIPDLLAHFEDNQQLYLVQELIDGNNLAQVVEEEGTFSEVEIWQLLNNILPVIKFIHEHQVIHRDIKPQNIIRCLLSSSSPYQEDRQFVLVDFGAAKRVTGTEILQQGTRIGSPEYVAPEQVRGKAVFASDLYSLGVTCIYLLTGITPFELFDVINNCWVWQDYLTQEISPNLTQILNKLLAYALISRFHSVEEVMEAIENRLDKVEVYTPVPLKTFPTLWQCRYTLEGNTAINAVAISPDGCFLATGSDDKSICLWDLNTRKAIAIFTGHSSAVKSVAFSPDKKLLASSSDDKTIKLWNISSHQEIWTLLGHTHAVKSLAFSPDGTFLASGSWDKTIKLWDVKTGVLKRTLTGHNLQVTAVAFSPCGKVLASASCDRNVQLWDLPYGLSSTLKGHSRSVVAVAFSPDGKTLATGSDDNTVIFWDWKTSKPLNTFSGHSWSVVAVVFTPDGEMLLSGSWDKTIKQLMVKTGQEIATLTGHFDSVSGVAVSLDGQMIVSGSKDQTVKLWYQHE